MYKLKYTICNTYFPEGIIRVAFGERDDLLAIVEDLKNGESEILAYSISDLTADCR